MRVVTFKVEADLLEQIDIYAMNHGLNRSEAIRLAMQKLIEEERKKEKPLPPAKIEKFRL